MQKTQIAEMNAKCSVRNELIVKLLTNWRSRDFHARTHFELFLILIMNLLG